MKRKNLVLQAILSIAFIIGSGALLAWTLNSLSITMGALGVVSLVMLSILLFMIGATWLGRISIAPASNNPYSNSRQGVTLALTVIAAGALLLAFNTGALPAVWKGFFFSWPMLLILFGFNEFCKLHFIPAIVLAAIGKFFLFDHLATIYPDDALYEQFTSTYWPVLIIIVGVLIFLQLLIRPRFFSHQFCHRNNAGRQAKVYGADRQEDANSDGFVNYSYFFGGAEQVFLDPVFKGGVIEAVFGGVNLDLRQTSLPAGDTILQIHTLFGGAEITVPADWRVEIRPKTFFGGVSDTRHSNRDTAGDRKLIICAECLCGGVVIK